MKYRSIVILLLLIHLSIVAWRSSTESFVWDEVGHLASGISHLETGRFDLYRVNPPLVRTLPAIGPFLTGYQSTWEEYSPSPIARAEFSVGADFVNANGEDSFWLLKLARWTTIWSTLLGAWITFKWSTEIYGQNAGLIALTLWCFSPLVLANAALITADCSAASVGVLLLYRYSQWYKSRTPANCFLWGIVFGLALLTKTIWMVGFLLFPLLTLLLGLYSRLCTRDSPKHSFDSRAAKSILVVFTIAVIVVNVGYGFESSFRPIGEFEFVSELLSRQTNRTTDEFGNSNRFSGTMLHRLPVPLPENFLMGMDVQKSDFENCKASYLLGEWRSSGWWYYYLYGLLVKEPISTWLLLCISLLSFLLWRSNAKIFSDEIIVLVTGVAILVLVSSQTGMNHHVRYVLPSLPFLFIFISRIGMYVGNHRATLGISIGSLLFAGVIGSCSVLPHSITYFNFIAGGVSNGHRCLDNSNLDWGQGLLHLRNWKARKSNCEPFFLASRMCIIDPSVVGLNFTAVPTEQELKASTEKVCLTPGWYALSCSDLISVNQYYSYFENLTPVERVANVYWIYFVSAADAREIDRVLNE